MKTKINDIFGGRRRLTLPAQFCRVLNLKKDDFITMSLENGGVMIRPVKVCDNCTQDYECDECPSANECADCENAVDCLIDTILELEPRTLVVLLTELIAVAIEVIEDGEQR